MQLYVELITILSYIQVWWWCACHLPNQPVSTYTAQHKSQKPSMNQHNAVWHAHNVVEVNVQCDKLAMVTGQCWQLLRQSMCYSNFWDKVLEGRDLIFGDTWITFHRRFSLEKTLHLSNGPDSMSTMQKIIHSWITISSYSHGQQWHWNGLLCADVPPLRNCSLMVSAHSFSQPFTVVIPARCRLVHESWMQNVFCGNRWPHRKLLISQKTA